MKISRYILVAATLATCLSCVEENFDQNTHSNLENIEGAVRFGLSPDTKTVYGSTYQINWVDGDQIAIYSAEALDNASNRAVQRATYTVSPLTNDAKKGTISAISENVLKWGSESEHTFYAVYPSNDNIKIGFTPEGAIDPGKIYFPAEHTQYVTLGVKDNNNNYPCTPDMKNAYMVAKASGTPAQFANKPVFLNFEPIMTTLDIVVKGRDEENAQYVTITGVSIGYDLPTDSPTTRFKYDADAASLAMQGQDTTATKHETIFVGIKNGTNKGDYLDLEPGETVTLTAFVPPFVINNDRPITIRVHSTGGTEVKATLKGASIAPKSRRKINLPAYPKNQLNGNNWITPLNDDIYVSQLSIPGTHDAATMNCALDAGKCQSKSITEQLLLGIRAFDLRPTTPDYTETGGFLTFGSSRTCTYETGDNKNLPIYHGSISCGVTLTKVFKDFNDYLEQNPGEFIIVTLRWENEGAASASLGGSISYQDGSQYASHTFAKAFREFIKDESKYPTKRRVKFKNNLTIGEMRGKILIIHRGLQGSSPDEFYTLKSTEEAQDGVVFVTGWPAGGEKVTTDAFFKSHYEGKSIGSMYCQDYYNVKNTTSKIDLIKKELGYSSQSHTNETYKHIWFINHCSGYSGALFNTATGQAYANNAKQVNLPIYEYITSETFVGSTGIMMLDFVGDRFEKSTGNVEVYGDLLPQAIIDNNYKFRMKRSGE